MLLEQIFQWVSQYGYFAIFILLVLGIVGLPVPDETLLTFTGFLVYKGQMHFGYALAAGVAGSVGGITLSYLLGRWLGLALVHRYGRYIHLTEERIQKVHDWFERIGHWTLTFGYYVPGVRHFTAYTAGTVCMPFREFAAFAYSGAFIWCLSFISLGYFFGEQWETILETAHHNILVVSIAAGVLLLLYLGWRYWKRRKTA